MTDGPFLLRLAALGVGTDRTVPPGRVADQVLDAVGCILSGARHPMVALLDAPSPLPTSGSFYSVAGGSEVSLDHAILLDSVACHVDEFDSIHPVSATAPASVVIPPALIVGAMLRASGHQVLDAVSYGYDVLTAAAGRWGGSELYAQGWWPTSSFGALGAAAATGHLLGLDQPQLANALGIAATSMGGLLSTDLLSEGHYLSGARAAQNGTRAAFHAAQGAQASWSLLDKAAELAFGPPRHDDPPRSGTILETVVKWYPCARPLHGVVEAMRELASGGVDLADLVTVEITLHPHLLRFLNTHSVVSGPTEAAASAVFCLAATAVGRESDPTFFRDGALPPGCVVPRVTLHAADHTADAWGVAVRATTGDGEELHAGGSPDAGLNPGRLREKFLANAESALPPSSSATLLAALHGLPTSSDVAPLLTALATASSRPAV